MPSPTEKAFNERVRQRVKPPAALAVVARGAPLGLNRHERRRLVVEARRRQREELDNGNRQDR